MNKFHYYHLLSRGLSSIWLIVHRCLDNQQYNYSSSQIGHVPKNFVSVIFVWPPDAQHICISHSLLILNKYAHKRQKL